MQNYVEEDWESGVFVKKKGAGARSRNLTEKKGHTGNVVPFFPTDWKKNANDVFNLIMNGQEATETTYDDTTHAAIHRKVEVQSSLSPFLSTGKQPDSRPVDGGRPTSGKHYAREHAFSKRKGELQPPNQDPLTSSVAKNFETSKKVEGLLNRLAGYMAGEIPESGDLTDMFAKAKSPNATATMTDHPDDATTNYTKGEGLGPYPTNSKEPIYAPPDVKVAETIEAEDD